MVWVSPGSAGDYVWDPLDRTGRIGRGGGLQRARARETRNKTHSKTQLRAAVGGVCVWGGDPGRCVCGVCVCGILCGWCALDTVCWAPYVWSCMCLSYQPTRPCCVGRWVLVLRTRTVDLFPLGPHMGPIWAPYGPPMDLLCAPDSRAAGDTMSLT